MARIQQGRTTHDRDGDLAVFLIGVRFNRLHRVDQWLPVVRAMTRMLTELYGAKSAAAAGEGEDLGFLDARSVVDGKGLTVVQYWRSAADVYASATSTEHAHRPAWAAFNSRARKAAGAVGIWHETYAVPAGAHESLYVGMTDFGLARATTSVPVEGSRRTPASLRA